MPQTLIELTGASDAQILNIMPANGFPPETYLPMLRPLSYFRAICLPPRALWGDELPPPAYCDWGESADDLLAAFRRHDMRNIVAVGHSLGGIISMLTVIKEPARFKALVMLDPVILPPAVLDMLGGAWESGTVEELPLVRGSRRRRRFFESHEDAYARFRAKRVFADWSEETLRLYVDHGLQPRADGDGYELSWSTEWEAHYFATVYRRIWQDLPKLNDLAPTLIIRASHSDTFPEAAYERARSLLPTVDFHEMKGQGHLFPQAAPLEAAKVIGQWLGKG